MTNRPRPDLLPEVEGIRALAVAVVLMYHAHFGFSGGYVGVDVFFVVSGFLITGLLLRDRQTHGRIRFAEFYARRARRLLPAATLVLAATVALTRLLLDPVRAHHTAVDAAYAAGFMANFHFATLGADYLHSTLPPSALQHWWSLAVEEQFYVVWPALLGLVWWKGQHLARRALALTAVVGVASLAMSIRLTDHNPAWGYFASWTRAWELAVGAMCTFAWTHRDRLPLRAGLGWFGLVAVVGSALRFDAGTAFPGIAALVPVLGTALVILSIGARRGPGAVLSLAPMQWVGGRSYAIYLWHWPLLVVLEARITSPDVAWRVGALAASIALAAGSYVALENPVRHLPALARSSARSLALGGGLVALLLGGAVVVARATDDVHFSTGYTAPTTPATTHLVTTPLAPLTPNSTPAPSATGNATFGDTPPSDTSATTTAPDWGALLATKIATELQPTIAGAVAQHLLPDNITPRLSDQANDDVRTYKDGCTVEYHGTDARNCVYGDPHGTTVVALYGDSHAAQWFPALETAALANHWKLLVVTKAACATADIWSRIDASQPYPECPKWRSNAFPKLLASDADLVIMTQYSHRYNNRPEGALISRAEWRDALARPAMQLLAAGKKVLFLGDIPIPRRLLDQCLASHPRNITTCNVSRAKGVDSAENLLERDLAAQIGARFYDPTDWMCAGDVCPAVVGNMAVYLDTDHLNNTYSGSLAPYMSLLVKSLLS
jgi:peptidoglycan/LPS O-acetylase OafA/YrhL